jgi:Domain of unknown function DUF488
MDKFLFDIGYSEIKDPDLLRQVAEKLDALVLDARFSPRSRNPKWNQGNLKNVLGDRYLHVKGLGNKNYKGGPIDFVDLEGAIQEVESLLTRNPVIVMCMCPERDRCHRYEFVQIFEKRTGTYSTPLTRALCLNLLDLTGPAEPAKVVEAQLKLF